MMRMDDPPDRKPAHQASFALACVIVGACAFIVAFFLAAAAFLT